MKSLALALIVLAVIFAILAVLYFVGAIQLFTRTGSGRHTTHAIVLGILAILSLVAANFARRQPASNL